MLTRPCSQPAEVLTTSTILPFAGVFYGYSAVLIAQWCLVSLRHAHRLKSGKARPTPRILKLFQLHAYHQVLTPAWAGWQLHDDVLVNPQGETLTRRQLEAYVIIWQLASEHARDSVFKVLEQLQESA